MGLLQKYSLKTDDSKRTKAAELTLKQSLYPIILVTILFFLWGFSYGLLDTLNKHFQDTLGITKARSSGLQAAYFGAYPLASLGHANWILRHYSYRACFIWGLCLYAIGSLIAWPCLVYRTFGGFCAAIFIIGNGLGSLETAANPYITVCGPPKYSELRINISQAFNGIGTVVAPVIGSYAIFLDVGEDAQALRNTQWIYLAIAIFTFTLAVVFFFSTIPEITDADMEFQAEETHANTAVKPFWQQYRLFHATFAQFCYTGAQVAIAGYFINYVADCGAHPDAAVGAKFLAGAQGGFAIGRFVGAFLMKFIRPRWVFLVFLTMCFVFCAPAATTYGGEAGMAMLFIVLFFESICFPTIVALGMRGLGKYSKRGSGFIVAGVSGGAVVPPILGASADAFDPVTNQRGTVRAMVVPTCFFIAAWSYALCVNFVKAYREPADKFHMTKVGIENVGRAEDSDSSPAADTEKGVFAQRQEGESPVGMKEVR